MELVRELKWLKPGKVSLDGTHVKANAAIDKLRTEKAMALDGRGNDTVEPVFGIIKAAMGFREFSLRGKEKVSGEWTLVCNLKRLHRMTESVKNNGGRPKSPSMYSNVNPNDIGTSPVGISLRCITDTICRRLHLLIADSTVRLSLTPTDSYA